MKTVPTLLVITLLASSFNMLHASDEEELKKRGATKIRKENGAIISLRVDCKGWTKAEFQLVAKQSSLKLLSLSGATIDDETFPLLLELKNLEILQFNQATISDEGFKLFQKFPKLKGLAFFHHARNRKDFDGRGLKYLTNVKTITFAGAKTGDVAMQAVGTLTQLESYSQWHNNETATGMQHLLKLKNLKSLRLGQRLPGRTPESKKPSLTEETIEIIAQLKNLESIDLFEARLSYKALSQLKELPHLKRLNIRMLDTPQADIDRITKELSNVKIKWTPLTKKEKASLTKKLKI